VDREDFRVANGRSSLSFAEETRARLFLGQRRPAQKLQRDHPFQGDVLGSVNYSRPAGAELLAYPVTGQQRLAPPESAPVIIA
jgi:hypothetical protein